MTSGASDRKTQHFEREAERMATELAEHWKTMGLALHCQYLTEAQVITAITQKMMIGYHSGAVHALDRMMERQSMESQGISEDVRYQVKGIDDDGRVFHLSGHGEIDEAISDASTHGSYQRVIVVDMASWNRKTDSDAIGVEWDSANESDK